MVFYNLSNWHLSRVLKMFNKWKKNTVYISHNAIILLIVNFFLITIIRENMVLKYMVNMLHQKVFQS